jgi:hypothetical protein
MVGLEAMRWLEARGGGGLKRCLGNGSKRCEARAHGETRQGLNARRDEVRPQGEMRS